MSLDIDDILAELDRDTTAVEMSSEGPKQPGNDSMDILNSSLDGTKTVANGRSTSLKPKIISPVEDFNKLVTLWKNERCSPELLPYPHQLMRRMLIRIEEQMEHLEILSMNFFEESTNGGSSANGKRNSNAPANNNKMLPLLCMEAELERVKFVIRSYIRCRLSKVDKYSIYLRQINEQFLTEELEEDDMDNENRISPLETLMSSEEIQYHQRHFSLLLNLLNESVLKYMSDDLQAINDTEGSVNMVDEPDWNKFVFVKVIGPPTGENDFDPLLIHKLDPERYYYSITIPETNEDIELIIGSIYIVRYNLIKDLLKDDKIELI
ncbi:DNA replication complex GINS protein Sld5p [Monosporozyma unispora]|nr:GINS complex subunit [Kazachstania unispora]